MKLSAWLALGAGVRGGAMGEGNARGRVKGWGTRPGGVAGGGGAWGGVAGWGAGWGVGWGGGWEMFRGGGCFWFSCSVCSWCPVIHGEWGRLAGRESDVANLRHIIRESATSFLHSHAKHTHFEGR